jgi:predicted nuclease of predicted toxin-antitoxin system
MGHDVVTASAIGLSDAKDSEILERAAVDRRVLLSRDKDFGALVFVQKLGQGVIYLRITPLTIQATHNQLKEVLERNSESDLAKAFVVIEPGGYRIRKFF